MTALIAALASVPAGRRTALTPLDHARLHHQAIALAALWPEFLGGAPKPSACPFDHHETRTQHAALTRQATTP